ncbi:MAG: aminoglycoside phosphotransferase family protein [Dehalococcoidia bacterium]
MSAPDFTRLRAPVERLLGRRIVGWTPIASGYTQATRCVATFDDGSSAFVKAATDDDTDGWLQVERIIYDSCDGGFLPSVLGWTRDDHGRRILVLEDLSRGVWPPPWSSALIERVLTTLSAVASTPPPERVRRVVDQREHFSGWYLVERDVAPFLSLGVCSAEWLQGALPVLLQAEASAPLERGALLHLDVRSDNICFDGERTVLVDWNWASVGNSELDLVAWLPSLHTEGGPLPDDVYDGEPGLVAMIAGYLAGRAGLPAPEYLRRVRDLQLRQLTVALPWAARALGLPPPQ